MTSAPPGMSSVVATSSAASSSGLPSCGSECTRRRYLFSGRVQGVGFRYTTKNIAIQHDVAGYVRNLPDGRVELVMEGAPREIDAVIQALNRKMNGYIRDVETNVWPATGEFDYFHIRH